jgi:hypothetical protein
MRTSAPCALVAVTCALCANNERQQMKQLASSELTTALLTALPLLARFLAPMVREELQATTDVDPWVPHPRWQLPNPTRHASKIDDARKVGRVWLCRRSALDKYIEAQPRRATPTPANDAEPSELQKRVAALGFGPATPKTTTSELMNGQQLAPKRAGKRTK